MSDDGRLLRVEGLSKTFLQTTYRPLFTVRREVTQALADVSFAVRAGTVTALLGPNGAGKTTMINIICDLVRPDAGSVHVAGQRVPDPEGLAQRQIGLVTSDERASSGG
jgi:ABC-type multidrug transport system ATPase subunit